MGYTKSEIIMMCDNAMNDASIFYKNDFVNYRGKTTDTNELYTEIASGYLCDHIDEYRNIPVITRESSYCVDTHEGAFSVESNRVEEITAMKMVNQCKDGSEYDYIGRMIDYQIPLKNARNDVAGKIDIISVKDDTVFILEFKREYSSETMLRCVLEGYTYLKTLNVDKLISDFCFHNIKHVKASPLVYRNKKQWKEMQDDRPQLKRLMNALDSKPFYISLKNNKYLIRED